MASDRVVLHDRPDARASAAAGRTGEPLRQRRATASRCAGSRGASSRSPARSSTARDDGTERGVRVVRLRTGEIERRGGRRPRARPRRRERARHARGAGSRPRAWPAPWFADPHGWGPFRTFFGGLLTTCGLEHTLGPAEDSAAHFNYPGQLDALFPLHGRLSVTPALLLGYGIDWDAPAPAVFVRGDVRQANVFGEVLTLEREIRAPARRPHHRGPRPRAQRGLRADAADDPVPRQRRLAARGARTRASTGRWASRASPRGRRRASTGRVVDEPTARHRRAGLGAHADRRRERLAPRRGAEHGHRRRPRALGLEVAFGLDTLPRMFQWRVMNEGHYVIGLEPGNMRIQGRHAAREAGDLVILQPGETRDYAGRPDAAQRALGGAGRVDAPAQRGVRPGPGRVGAPTRRLTSSQWPPSPRAAPGPTRAPTRSCASWARSTGCCRGWRGCSASSSSTARWTRSPARLRGLPARRRWARRCARTTSCSSRCDLTRATVARLRTPPRRGPTSRRCAEPAPGGARVHRGDVPRHLLRRRGQRASSTASSTTPRPSIPRAAPSCWPRCTRACLKRQPRGVFTVSGLRGRAMTTAAATCGSRSRSTSWSHAAAIQRPGLRQRPEAPRQLRRRLRARRPDWTPTSCTSTRPTCRAPTTTATSSATTSSRGSRRTGRDAEFHSTTPRPKLPRRYTAVPYRREAERRLPPALRAASGEHDRALVRSNGYPGPGQS